MKRNRGVVQLSDGREVIVEADHNGLVHVCLVYGPEPEGAALMHWSGVSATTCPRDVYVGKLMGHSPASVTEQRYKGGK